MKGIAVLVLVLLGYIYNVDSLSLKAQEHDSSPRILFRQLLDDQLDPFSTNVSQVQAQIVEELEHMEQNSRTYLASIRVALMNFACRIGLTRLCITNDLPVIDDLPDVPPFPSDFPKTESSKVVNSDTNGTIPTPTTSEVPLSSNTSTLEKKPEVSKLPATPNKGKDELVQNH